MKVVNFQETKRRFDESGRSPSKFARLHGIAETTFRRFLNGQLDYSQGEKYDHMVKALRDNSCLVEEEVEEKAA